MNYHSEPFTRKFTEKLTRLYVKNEESKRQYDKEWEETALQSASKDDRIQYFRNVETSMTQFYIVFGVLSIFLPVIFAKISLNLAGISFLLLFLPVIIGTSLRIGATHQLQKGLKDGSYLPHFSVKQFWVHIMIGFLAYVLIMALISICFISRF